MSCIVLSRLVVVCCIVFSRLNVVLSSIFLFVHVLMCEILCLIAPVMSGCCAKHVCVRVCVLYHDAQHGQQCVVVRTIQSETVGPALRSIQHILCFVFAC
jgi:hypothetical protein